MNASLRAPRSHCAISFTLDVVGDRWSLLVLRDLILRSQCHFEDLLATTEVIATNILATRLGRLEQHGLIVRRPDPDDARQVIYEPTGSICCRCCSSRCAGARRTIR
jgi:DNA-binding HxlR family transcriptional regulator